MIILNDIFYKVAIAIAMSHNEKKTVENSSALLTRSKFDEV